MKTFKIFLFLGLVLFGTTACALFMPSTTARVKAWHRVEPVIDALEAFRKEHGSYPATLEELRPRYLKENVRLEELHDGAVVWGLYYKKKAPDVYELSFSDAFSDATYQNGKLISASSNVFR